MGGEVWSTYHLGKNTKRRENTESDLSSVAVMPATTHRRGSRESSSDICLVADLTIDFGPSYDVE